MIEVRRLTKTFPARHGQTAVLTLEDISLSVKEQEFVCLLGPSGCGKTTLLKIIGGLIPWDTGEVLIEGEPVTGPGRERGMVFQNFALLPWADTLANVAFGLELRGVPKEQREATAANWIAAVGLQGFERRYPRDLSGGMQQRVGLARALATDPEIMLFDEPFSALDPLIRRDMQDEVIKLQREVRKTMIFITHDLMEALKLGDRIAIMKDGRFVQVGTPEEVVARPADSYVADFTRDVPRAHVLTVRTIMTPANGNAPSDGPRVTPDTVIQELLPLVADSDQVIRVVDEDRVVGLVDRRAVVGALVEER
jgi:glycine betaine/proline transport system ATP-binding protein